MINNIIAFVQGMSRFQLYYSKYFNWLIPTHVREQIDWRLTKMRKACYKSGSCVMCGCETPALQMANKACDNPCYPGMMGKKMWDLFKKGELIVNGFSYE